MVAQTEKNGARPAELGRCERFRVFAQEMEDRRRETGDGRHETRDRRQETELGSIVPIKSGICVTPLVTSFSGR